MKKKILIAEDEIRLRRLVRDFLIREDYEVIEANDGSEAVKLFKETSDIAYVLLDVMMPFLDGWEACKTIRMLDEEVPIMMLTAKGEEYDELKGFQCGATDYVKKPFSPIVLMARIKAQLKLTEQEDTERITRGVFTLHKTQCKVYRGETLLDLSPIEYDLMVFFLTHPNQVFTRETLLDRIWGMDYEGDIRTVDTHINRLRTKLQEDSSAIETVRGKGYTLIVK